MDVINISIPPNLQPFVSQRAAEAGRGDVGRYVLGLIEADQAQRDRLTRLVRDPGNRRRIAELLDEALDAPTQPLDVEAMRREVRENLSSSSDR